ncbi:855f46aa-30b4-48e2-91f7-240db3e0f69b [Sclerotinia trifoliorum]|uniref:pectin lyase n=1 Tax=Sclerotinia trifoliorum TaxID=28548 RepID=A0A8H2ZQX7_9HELO|nr:855f46aa-30b4-48e2-91f7-240db3e0f69b [Sclerotinia trifoliorum]
MKSFTLFSAAVAAYAQISAAIAVHGAAEGFAKGVTGGGSATPVYPTTNAELVSYLGDSSPRVIVLNKTFNFRGTEGTKTETGCAPWGTGAACQLSLSGGTWCANYAPNAPKVSVTYDAAGPEGITVASHKTLIGQGSTGVIQGKGLRIVGGATNVIVQNIKIEELNPKYVWGGDAISIADSDMVWIDRVTTYHIGRQHIVLGTGPSNRVTLSNNYINGVSDYSTSCNGYHYWGIYLDGSSDMVTMKGNYIYHTSGRSPKVAGNTLLHAVNNYWYDNGGHAFEIDTGAYVVAEGNVFQNIPTVAESPISGQLFTAPSPNANTACKAYLGHNCEVNGFGSSGTFTSSTTGFFSDFSGKNVASAAAYTTVVSSVNANAGFGKI